MRGFAENVPLKDTLMIANDIRCKTLEINITNNTVLLFFVKWPVQSFFYSFYHIFTAKLDISGRQAADEKIISNM